MNNRKMLILITGLPGSGKTTLAKKFQKRHNGIGGDIIDHFEADMYFTDADGTYNYVAGDIGKAHEWCQKKVEESLVAGHQCIVSNTSRREWERKPYFEMARKHKASMVIIHCRGNYTSIHDVPVDTINKMRETTEEFIEHEWAGIPMVVIVNDEKELDLEG